MGNNIQYVYIHSSIYTYAHKHPSSRIYGAREGEREICVVYIQYVDTWPCVISLQANPEDGKPYEGRNAGERKEYVDT